MKIIELLKNIRYSGVWVQGHHTRILLTGTLYEVLSRKSNSIKGTYPDLKYQGHDEEKAVAHFIESEKL